MLPSTPQVESVYLDPEAGVLAGLKEVPADSTPLNGTKENISNGAESTGSLQGSSSSSAPGTAADNTPHTLLIDQTTLDPTFAMSLAEKVQSETLGHALMLDAPVSGGEEGQPHCIASAERGARYRCG